MLVAVKPPYSMFNIVLLGPPLLALWIAFSYEEYVPRNLYGKSATEKAKPE